MNRKFALFPTTRLIRVVGRMLGGTLVILAAATGALAGFYDTTPADLRGPPGSLIRFQGIPDSFASHQAFLILYRSTAPDGKAIAVSGIVIAPVRKAPPGGWPVIAWAHGTTGVVRNCAPSLLPNPVGVIPGIDRMLARGYVVVATDYPGLGTAGPHPYLVGESEGRAVLDSVRAARTLSMVGGGSRFALWGYSQGGHAALFAGQLVAKYAPELKLVGVAVAAPATKLGQLFENNLETLAGRILTAMVLRSWSQFYGHALGGLIVPAAMSNVTTISRQCINIIVGELADLRAEKKLPRAFLLSNPTTTRPWSVAIAANVPTLAPPAPLYIAQGTADTVVDPNVTVDFVKSLCRQGASVLLVKYANLTHHRIARSSATNAVNWINDRFAGKPAPSNCGR